jgi:hypothetical protein
VSGSRSGVLSSELARNFSEKPQNAIAIFFDKFEQGFNAYGYIFGSTTKLYSRSRRAIAPVLEHSAAATLIRKGVASRVMFPGV